MKQQNQIEEVTCLNDLTKTKKNQIQFSKENSGKEMEEQISLSTDKEVRGMVVAPRKLPLKSPKASIHERQSESDVSMGSVEGELNSAKKKMMEQFGVSSTFDVSKLVRVEKKHEKKKTEESVAAMGVQVQQT